jgi:TatD DNase family protein
VIDCHTHLLSPEFDADRPQVLERARRAGIEHVAIVGQDRAENELVLRADDGGGMVLRFLGLHPDRFADARPLPDPAEVGRIAEQIRAHAPALTGIGEVGLDRWVCREEDRRDTQREAFRVLIRLARELELPLNVHSRSAGHHTLELLLAEGATRVLMHAFDGKASHARRGAEAGYLFSIPPSIVRSEQKVKLVRALPLVALALETDSPVLGPERETRNEPANLTLAVAAIARIKGVDEAEVRARTSENARRLFRLP